MNIAADHSSSFPLRHPSVRTYHVREEAVLAGTKRHALLALNPTARAVWERCDGVLTTDEICRHLAHAYDMGLDEVATGVHAILSDFQARGLLQFKEQEARHAEPRPTHLFFVTFLHHHVEVLIDSPDLADAFRASMGNTFGEGGGITAGRIEVHPDKDGYRVRDNRGLEKIIPKLYDAVTWARRRANWLLIRARPDLLWLHAGAASQSDGAMLCAGDYGSGKSTLVTSLYQAGWTYFTDDVLPYDPATGSVLAYPHTPSYRQGGNELLELDSLPSLPRKRTPIDATRIAAEAVPLRLLVFPSFQPLPSEAPKQRSPAATVVKLIGHCFNMDTYCGDPVRALSALADAIPAYDVEHSGGSSARQAVEKLWPLTTSP